MSEQMQEQEQRFTEILQRMDRVYDEYAKAKGMSYMRMAVLETIYAHPDGCTQKQICTETHYPKQSVNLIIKSFLADGHVALREAAEDRRNKRITLTAHGRAYADETVGALWDIDRRSAGVLSAEQRELLLQLLARYADAFARGVRQRIGRGFARSASAACIPFHPML